ncbi:Membrane protein involved in the export of O-antigen and teichoic acid [[Clostridium] ultunense Esp]|nr:Membrane protein involved in the export of O-antigen and teichoic acid [[Clostridium] ultunense Esp]
MSQRSKSFIQGAFILGSAALISKLLGAIYRIPYQNITGDIGLYVYNQVYPLYTILLFLSTSGFPKAISKMIAEKTVLGDEEGAFRIFRIASTVLFMTGFFFFFILYVGAPYLAKWSGDENLTLPFRSISYALLIVPFLASIRGFFQGNQNMLPTAISQIAEQMVRVLTILILSYWFIAHGYSAYYAGAGAVFGAFTGALASAAVLFTYLYRFRRQKGNPPARLIMRKKEPAFQVMKEIMKYSIPISLASLLVPLLQLVDSFTVKNLLDLRGFPELTSMNLKGVYDRGMPLVQFAAFLAAPLTIALLPAISEAAAKGRRRQIARQTDLALRVTLLFSLPASIGLMVIAEPVNIFIYMDNKGSDALAILAFTTLFSTLNMTTAGILQGIGLMMLPARNLFVGIVVKLFLNLTLIPLWDIRGAAFSTVIAYGIATFLNLRQILKFTDFRPNYKLYITRPLLSVLMMALSAWTAGVLSGRILLLFHLPERLYNGGIVLFSILSALFVYSYMLLKIGAIRANELEMVPKLNRFVPLFKKWNLFRE